MAIDSYALCPCGSGKKVKFCCSDMVGDIEQIQKMLKGNQSVACLQYIETLLPKHPNHPFLMRIKAALQSRLGQDEKAAGTIQAMLDTDPQNASALAEKAMLTAKSGDARSAIGILQDAIAACDGKLPGDVFRIISVVGTALLGEGEVVAGRGHLMLAAGIKQDDEEALGVLVELNRSESVPILLKQDASLAVCPQEVGWKAEFDAALEAFRKGCWAMAAEKFTALSEKITDSPALWRNLATLRGWLADSGGAAVAWRKLAALDIPLEDAVEAEAVARLIDPDSPTGAVDLLTVQFTVSDVDGLSARLSSDPICVVLHVPPESLAEGAPPPRAASLLLDRPMPETGVDLQVDAIPTILGQMLLFGRETDREARLELHITSDLDVAAAKKTVSTVGGDCLNPQSEDKVIGQIPSSPKALNWRWRLPDDTPREHLQSLLSIRRRQAFLTDWPNEPIDGLDGKTLAEAAKNPKDQIRVLAEILTMQHGMEQSRVEFDFNELRRALDLPVLEPIDPAGVVGRAIPLTRLGRVVPEKLTDNDLLKLFQHAQIFFAVAAIRTLGREIAGRESLNESVDKAEVFALLASFEEDSSSALELIGRARATALQRGTSPARWMLEELAMRLQRGEAEQAQRLVARIQSQHMKEPGIAQALLNVLAEAGIIGPDGRPAAAPAAAEPGLITPETEKAGASKLWTPGGGEPSGEKPALWTPGMD